jgi:hypothetical protein
MPIKDEAEMARTLNKLIIVDIEEGYRVPVMKKRQEISDMLAENKYNDPEVWQALMDYDILLGELLQRYEEVENVMEHLFEYYLTSEYSQKLRIPIKGAKPVTNEVRRSLGAKKLYREKQSSNSSSFSNTHN